MIRDMVSAHVSLIAMLLLLAAAPVFAEEEPLNVRGLAFSPDGKLLAVGTGDPKEAGTVSLWDVAARKRIWSHAEEDGVPAVAFSPDGKTLAIGGYGNVARLLDVDAGKVKATLEHPSEVRAVAFSPDGRRLVTACWDTLVRVWDLGNMTEAVRCKGHQDRIFVVDFSPDGKLLLSVGGDDGAKIWDAATGAEKRNLKHHYMYSGRFSADGRWVFTGSKDGTTRVWNTETGAERVRFSQFGGVRQLAVSTAVRTVAVCDTSRQISLFELNLNEPAGKELERIRALLVKLDDDSYDVRESASKEFLEIGFLAEPELRRAAEEAKSAEVRIRARRIRQEMLSQPRATLRGHTDEVLGVAFSPDGKLLASGGRDGTLRLWELDSHKEVARVILGKE